MSYNQRMRAFISFAWGAARKAAALGGDLVFATSTPLTIAFPAVYASRRLKVPMVFEVRDLWPELPIAIGALHNPVLRVMARRLERWSYRNAEAVVALSPGMRDGICRAGYPSERVAVIPNGSDNDMFAVGREAAIRFLGSREWLGARPLVVYAGTFGRMNGVGYLVGLAKHLQSLAPDVRILLIGDGQERRMVEHAAGDAGVLGRNLFMEDRLPKAQMPDVLSAADLAVSLFVDLPEMQANSANKFFDALASGTPVLVNYGGWQAALVERADAGLVAWGMPLKQAAERVAAALGNKAWLRQAGANARRLAEDLFDRDMLAKDLAEVLVAAAGGQGMLAGAIGSGDFSKRRFADPEEAANESDRGHA
jgi:glycosyltransferase involved in cell wall biosynthesis